MQEHKKNTDSMQDQEEQVGVEKIIKSYRGNEPFLFVSYAHDDSKLVRSIISQLQHDSYRVWYDEGIAPAVEYEPEILNRLRESVCGIFFISANFLSSDWCRKEMCACIESGKELLLVFFEGKKPPENYQEFFKIPEKDAEILSKKQHVFWDNYRNKRSFYSKLEECPALETAREGLNLENKTPISKTIYNTDEIKRKIDDSLQYSDLLVFGRYPTGSNGESGEIIWRVIAVEGDRLLLLSEYLLDARQFHEEIEEVCWESCDLQKWLNSEFYNQAFNEEEKKYILTRRLETPLNRIFGTACGSEIEKPVFLLSAEELYLYFTENPDSFYQQNEGFQTVGQPSFLQGKYTRYALTKTSYSTRGDQSGWWWLRTSGEERTKATRVTSTPQLDMKGVFVKFPVEDSKPAGGVRPAIWIRR